VFGNAEAYYTILRTHNQQEALRKLVVYQQSVQPVTTTVLVKAMNFRLKHKNEDLSYADCVGYATAQELGIPFLTGDRRFKDKPGVAFIA
jgi:predicted nucleic acid-binding protein